MLGGKVGKLEGRDEGVLDGESDAVGPAEGVDD